MLASGQATWGNNLGSEVMVLMDPISKSSWGSSGRESTVVSLSPLIGVVSARDPIPTTLLVGITQIGMKLTAQ